ncbi:MAG TPA: ABC transporter ATP-binding protein, partial [Firmicutes bacterium]|nr:ABC transporter ATP-binding protein [Bacillota bacterium]
TDNQINDFMKTLSGTEVSDIHEIKETLEDYFMSFYKENKTFGGI